MKTDRIFGLCVIGVALAYIASATQIQVGFLSDPVGSRTFPYIVGAVALVCALAIVLRPDDEPGVAAAWRRSGASRSRWSSSTGSQSRSGPSGS